MHVPDGFLAPAVTVPAIALATPLWVLGVRRHFGRDAAEALPLLGALSALAFVLQTLRFPLPGGTSIHVVGATLLALTRGPLAAFVCESLVLAVQALFFGVGGVTTLGVNALAVGLVGPTTGWLVHRVLAGRGRWASFLAGWAGLQGSTLAVAGVLALQHRLSPEVFPVPLGVVLTAMMLPSLTVGGIAEGVYTAFALGLVERLEQRARA